MSKLMEVDAQGISVGFAGRDLLRLVDLTVPAGSSIALMGPSGSGKTTLLNILSGLHSPDSGSVTIGGTSLYEGSEKSRTEFRSLHIGLIPQFPSLVGHLSGLQNTLLGTLSRQRSERASARVRAMEILEELEVDACADLVPAELSGGQKQRICIARALLNRPSVILADEPTASLPITMRTSVLSILLRSGATLVASTHDDRVASHFDRIEDIEQWLP